MRREALAAAVLAGALIACGSSLPPGARYETVQTHSLPSPGEALVITPPSYDASPQKRYPVLYFLHDGYGDGHTLARRGVAAEALARMRDGRLPEFLIVAPEGSGSWFSDSYDGARRFEEFLTGDLPRAVEERYRVLPGKQARGITGISMGGYGSVKLALKHPELFASVSALSGAIIPIGWKDLDRYSFMARYTLKRVFGRLRAEERARRQRSLDDPAGSLLSGAPVPGRAAGGHRGRLRSRRRRGAVREPAQRARRADDDHPRARRARLGLLEARDAGHPRLARPAV